jgi:hypothetical protein
MFAATAAETWQIQQRFRIRQYSGPSRTIYSSFYAAIN